jgi:hypothetical protein
VKYDNDVEMSDVSMASNTETNTPETKEERGKRKNRERVARHRKKHKKKSLCEYSDIELDNIREKGRLRAQKCRAKRKAQEQNEAADTK